VRPSRSRRRRRLTAAINALSGAVAVGSLLVVIELGAPVAANLGLSAGLPWALHGGTPSTTFQDPNVSTFGPGVTTVNSNTPASVAPAPAPTEALADASVATPRVTAVATAAVATAAPAAPTTSSVPVLSQATVPVATAVPVTTTPSSSSSTTTSSSTATGDVHAGGVTPAPTSDGGQLGQGASEGRGDPLNPSGWQSPPGRWAVGRQGQGDPLVDNSGPSDGDNKGPCAGGQSGAEIQSQCDSGGHGWGH
jgi:hypothetical protein